MLQDDGERTHPDSPDDVMVLKTRPGADNFPVG